MPVASAISDIFSLPSFNTISFLIWRRPHLDDLNDHRQYSRPRLNSAVQHLMITKVQGPCKLRLLPLRFHRSVPFSKTRIKSLHDIQFFSILVKTQKLLSFDSCQTQSKRLWHLDCVWQRAETSATVMWRMALLNATIDSFLRPTDGARPCADYLLIDPHTYNIWVLVYLPIYNAIYEENEIENKKRSTCGIAHLIDTNVHNRQLNDCVNASLITNAF